MEILDYTVLVSTSSVGLKEQVRKLLTKGYKSEQVNLNGTTTTYGRWIPQGGVALIKGEHSPVFSQAMIAVAAEK